jgi:Methyltransferase domain
VCGSSDFRKTIRGIVAPFLARRIWSREAFQVDLNCCNVCDFIFFNPRLDAEEEERLYQGYRDAEYLRARHAVEPWYTERFNSEFMQPDLLRRRKTALVEILGRRVSSNGSCRILDFGGSHGELVKDLLPNSTAYVYDISNVAPLDGVTPCSDLAECRSHEFDLIICSNVFEHVGSPRAIFEQIREIAASKTLLWIEVPLESPFNWNRRMRRLAQEAMLLALRPRVGLSTLKPGMLHWMHEHVNFFNTRSLQALLRNGGFEVLASDSYRLRSPLGSEEMVWAMGRLVAAAGE